MKKTDEEIDAKIEAKIREHLHAAYLGCQLLKARRQERNRKSKS